MPLKLPLKKPKGKGKQLHIDYATPDSARATAPADWSAEEWLEDGTRQEEQGERYQVGPKAARHLANATTCYRLAAALSPSSFDARYNAARVMQTLGADHLGPPECLEALEAARTGYREALAVLQPGQAGEATARIDALYNLAQADASLFAQFEDGICAVQDELERKRRLAQEAKELFVEVERLQRIELERYTGSGASSNGEEEDDNVDAPAGTATETTVQVTETTVVTPRLVIDTLLAAVDFDIQLSESSLSDSETDAQLRQSAIDAFSRASELRNVVAAQEGGPAADLDLDLALQQAEIFATWSPEEARSQLESLANAPEAAPRLIDVLSMHADFLIENLPLSDRALALSSLETALAAYQRAASLLSSRLSPPKNIPAQQLPTLLSANLASQAHVHLLAHLFDPPADPRARKHADEAQRLALEAISAAKPAVSLAVAGTFSSSAPDTLPAISAVRSANAQDARSDWATLAAVRNAFFTLVRVRYWAFLTAGASTAIELRTPLRARVWGEWKALGLAGPGREGAGGLEGLKRRELEWWAGEMEDDLIAKMVGPDEAATERHWYAALAP